jgi:CheY-like chemotaxis protein
MKRIMIVDDEPFIRQVFEDVLKEEGYDVLHASSGRTMFQVLETQLPDLILLDIMMPDGDGVEVMKAMRSRPELRDIPVVVVSTGIAHQRLKDIEVPILTKPVDLDQLLRIVKETVGPASLPDE